MCMYDYVKLFGIKSFQFNYTCLRFKIQRMKQTNKTERDREKKSEEKK